MDVLEILRKKAAALISESSQAADVQLGAELLKAVAEIEKQNAETRKQQNYIAIITPWVSTILLVAGFLLQGAQLRNSEHETAIAREDAHWAELQKSLATAASAGRMTSEQAAELGEFLSSREYIDRANNAADDALRLTNGVDQKSVAAFKTLFSEVFPRADWNNLDRVLSLDRSLSYDYDQIRRKDESDPRLQFIMQELDAIGARIAQALREPRPKSISVDFLSNVRVFDCDFSKVDLHGLNLAGFVADRVKLDHADLRDSISQNGHWGSLWWRADNIGTELHAYLCMNNDKFQMEAGDAVDSAESAREKSVCAQNQ
jgi:hypothetical protein